MAAGHTVVSFQESSVAACAVEGRYAYSDATRALGYHSSRRCLHPFQLSDRTPRCSQVLDVSGNLNPRITLICTHGDRHEPTPRSVRSWPRPHPRSDSEVFELCDLLHQPATSLCLCGAKTPIGSLIWASGRAWDGAGSCSWPLSTASSACPSISSSSAAYAVNHVSVSSLVASNEPPHRRGCGAPRVPVGRVVR